MERIEIELGMWESAPCPIYTENIKDNDLEWAEKELYQIAINSHAYTKEMVDDFLNGKGILVEDQYERERYLDFICEEEEKLVIEIGGIYYEDMYDDKICPYCEGTLIIDCANGLYRCLECGNEF